MNKYQEALDRLKTAPSFMGGTDLYKRHLNSEKLLMKDVNTLQELVDKETPKKPPLIWEHAKPQTRCQCTNGVYRYQNYCSFCGQKLDWSDEDGK